MTNFIHSIILFLAVACIFACFTQNNRGTQDLGEKNLSKIVNGIVTSITDGKDGYTAAVQTKNNGVYDVLVSIVNVGGPENYIRFNVGDQVTVQGVPNYVGDKQTLMVQLIIRDKSAVPGEKEATSGLKPAQPHTIAGRVISRENGKDGYMIGVETVKEGIFNAIVSIVNLGGPDNFQQIEVGDNVVLTGIPNYAMSTPSLKVEKIDKVAAGRTELLITPNSFRGITIGDKISKHVDYIQKEQLRTGGGTFEIYRIKDFNNNPAGYLMPDPKDNSIVGDITIETQMAATVAAIKVGSTFEQLNATFPTIEVHGSEIEGRTYATHNNISYRLDVPNFTYEVDKSKIPANTKITQIMLNRGYDAATSLNEKYSKITPEEYCWLVNDQLALYTKPNTNSLVQGNHFKGEVLSVLESRVIDNQVWVNVEFKLTIKTGYEDRFADGQVMSSGVPTGWIGGPTAPWINCK